MFIRMPATAPRSDARTTLGFNAARFDQCWEIVHGPMKIGEIAERLDVDPGHFSQIRSGKRGFSREFIAAVRVALPNAPFTEIFPVIDPAAGDAE
jgi:hypothetical protein